MRLVVVGSAAVEEHDRPIWGRLRPRHGRLAEPRSERPAGEDRQRRVAVDADDQLDQPAEEAVAKRPIRDRRRQDAQATDEVGLTQQPVSKSRQVARLELRPGAAVHLRDPHVRRAGDRAPAAARAPVDRPVRRMWLGVRAGLRGGERRDPEALRLRPDVLWPWEEVGHPGDRADRRADVALEAFIGRQANLEGAGLEVPGLPDDAGDRHARAPAASRAVRAAPGRPPASSWAACQPLAIATPSPHRSDR